MQHIHFISKWDKHRNNAKTKWERKYNKKSCVPAIFVVAK